jgi:biopolymer transport protein ExbD
MKNSKIIKTQTPISSLIDVIFLLIMFFVITSVISDEKVPVDLADTLNMKLDNQRIIRINLTIKKDGSTFIDNVRTDNKVTLQATISKAINKYGNGVIAVIRADKDVKHKKVNEVIKVLKDAKVRKFSIAAEFATSQ